MYRICCTFSLIIKWVIILIWGYDHHDRRHIRLREAGYFKKSVKGRVYFMDIRIERISRKLFPAFIPYIQTDFLKLILSGAALEKN